MKKLLLALVFWGSVLCTPVFAKTFVGVLWPMFGPIPAIGIVELVAELKLMPDVEVSTYLHQSWPSLVDDIGRQPFLIVATARDFALRRAVLPERRTGATLGDMQLRADLLNAGAATRGA